MRDCSPCCHLDPHGWRAESCMGFAEYWGSGLLCDRMALLARSDSVHCLGRFSTRLSPRIRQGTRRSLWAMRISRFAFIASTMAAAAIAVPATAHAEPTTVQQLCDAQIWPRPVPEVVGMLFEPDMKQIPAGAGGGALTCWDDIRSFGPDGQDASHKYLGPQRITAVSPPPGTPIGRHDLVTLQLPPIDYKAPPAFRPCDWVTASEAASFLGVPEPVKAETLYDRAGSVDVRTPVRTLTLDTTWSVPKVGSDDRQPCDGTLRPRGMTSREAGRGSVPNQVRGWKASPTSPPPRRGLAHLSRRIWRW